MKHPSAPPATQRPGKDDFGHPRLKVLLALASDVNANQEKLAGILRYAREHGPWDVQFLGLHPVYTNLNALEEWFPDGVILDGIVPISGNVRNLDIPFVQLDGKRPKKGAWVTHNSTLIARTAFNAFLERGFRNFAYVDLPVPNGWSLRRRNDFVALVRKGGYDCPVYPKGEKLESNDWSIERKSLAAWLRTLPTPCALMAAMDVRAHQVLEACRTEGISVPEGISVIGVDNDPLICDNSLPPLSSVHPDFEQGGFLAGKLLDALMHGRKRKNTTVVYGVSGFHHRASISSCIAETAFADKTNAILRLMACRGASVADVVTSLNVSRRYAEIHYKRATGRTILEAIHAHRFEKVCKLLKTTNTPITEIGFQCGFSDDAHLKRLFHSRYGMTMREFRTTHSRI